MKLSICQVQMVLDKIARLPAHFAYAIDCGHKVSVAIGGPLMDDQGRRIGLLFVYEAVSRDEALTFAQEDPFHCRKCIERLRDQRMASSRSECRSSHRGKSSRPPERRRKYAKSAVRDLREIRADKSRLATVRPAHWEYDRTLKNAGKLALAGPFADDEGGLFVYNAVRREEAMSYLEQDPFALEGVFADCELLEWLIEGLNPDLLAA